MSATMERTHPTVDAETIERAKAGHEVAYAALFRCYQPQLLRFLRALRCDEPDDVAAQVWSDVARAIDRFEGDGVGMQRWIFAIAHRRKLDASRSGARRERTLTSVAQHVEPPRPDVDEQALSLDRALELVRRLPPNMAEAVMLRVVSDLSVAHTAEIMGQSEANVRVLVHRGVARLRESLDDGDADHEPAAHGRGVGTGGAPPAAPAVAASSTTPPVRVISPQP